MVAAVIQTLAQLSGDVDWEIISQRQVPLWDLLPDTF
jgi:hypothetical protein